MASKRERLEIEIRELSARLARVKARDLARQRKREHRQALLVGKAIVEALKTGEEVSVAQTLSHDFDGFVSNVLAPRLSSRADRELFGLAPRS